MQDNTNQTIRDAETLIAKVQADLDAAAVFYRDNNIDPDKIASACAPFVGAKEKADIEKQAKADEEAIEQEVREGMARMNFSGNLANGSGASAVRKPRTMI